VGESKVEKSAKAWQREKRARELLKLLPDDFSRRKLRHFVCEWVRREELPRRIGKGTANVLAFAERIADDEANVDPDEWVAIWQELDESCENRSYAPNGCAAALIFTVGENIHEEALWVLDSISEPANARALALLREVFGNPFRPVDFAPWRTDTAVSLARQMYEARDFSALPILADALQDAGCANGAVLSHCREAKPIHCRGCWVVDGVLGKV
jgi:hypothetical protein